MGVLALHLEAPAPRRGCAQLGRTLDLSWGLGAHVCRDMACFGALRVFSDGLAFHETQELGNSGVGWGQALEH